MFNIKRIHDWKEKVQEDIDAIIEKHLVELNSIVKEEVPKNLTVYCRMGTCTIEDLNGTPLSDKRLIVKNFEDELANLSYRDAFLSNACIDEINIPKNDH